MKTLLNFTLRQMYRLLFVLVHLIQGGLVAIVTLTAIGLLVTFVHLLLFFAGGHP